MGKQSASGIIARIIRAIKRRIEHRFILHKARDRSMHFVQSSSPGNLLVLCYGNIYRSPFVANYLKKLLADREDICIKSAGFYPKSDRPSVEEFVILCKEYGVDLTAHRSTVVNNEMLEWADIIIIMDRKNWDQLKVFDEHYREKIYWIAAGEDCGSVEIQDPYGLPINDIRAICNQMTSASEKITGLIKESYKSVH